MRNLLTGYIYRNQISCHIMSTVIVIYTASVSWPVAGQKKQYDPGEIFVPVFCLVVSMQVDQAFVLVPAVDVYWLGKGGNDVNPYVRSRMYVCLHGALFLLQLC